MRRLDTYLIEEGYVSTREKAKHLITEGKVKVNGVEAKKGGVRIKPTTTVQVLSTFKYVGRGGYKIEDANDMFNISFNNKVVVDIGCSVGGFTDYALKQGSSKVYSIDTADILENSLWKDSRVLYYPGKDVRDFSPTEKVEIVLADVTFFHLEELARKVYDWIEDGGYFLALLKPSFQVDEKRYIDKKEVEKIKNSTIESVKNFGFNYIDEKRLNFKGKGAGQQEYFLLFEK